MLREQLDQANSANQALSEDLRKLTADWTKARDELEQRESEWRREEEVRAPDRPVLWRLAAIVFYTCSTGFCLIFPFVAPYSPLTRTSAMSTVACCHCGDRWSASGDISVR